MLIGTGLLFLPATQYFTVAQYWSQQRANFIDNQPQAFWLNVGPTWFAVAGEDGRLSNCASIRLASREDCQL